MNMNENNFVNNGNDMMDMNLMNNMMMNNQMMNMMMNMNQMNDMQKEKNELIIKLINQNNTLANQIEKNNSKIKNLVENKMIERNEYESYNDDIYFLDLCKIEFFPNYKCNKINIVFEKTNGLTLAMFAPINASVKELLMAFYIKLQIILTNKSKTVYELKDYYFIYNGQRINLDEKRTLLDYGILPNSKIIFGDNKDIKGGK